ncbi:hypothetical protein NEFER03_1742 [Nematocida sp. LUAm3]|nr:hypothetical protein NEFER03_1742 [Nematocida sp. LUAm3]KAI5175732.1 hypothetical protein NEFER02_1619 [Nematocida sp. LUAm2]KAI5178638.1 hypothetical protein NEFER01_1774 [Nematocida sp. LUAm1]
MNIKSNSINANNCSDEKASFLQEIIRRNKRVCRYISEGPSIYKERREVLKDMRPMHLKRKALVFSRYKELFPDGKPDACSICLVSYQKSSACATLRCKHIFHKTCIVSSLKVSGTCPLCRKDVISGERI